MIQLNFSTILNLTIVNPQTFILYSVFVTLYAELPTTFKYCLSLYHGGDTVEAQMLGVILMVVAIVNAAAQLRLMLKLRQIM